MPTTLSRKWQECKESKKAMRVYSYALKETLFTSLQQGQQGRGCTRGFLAETLQHKMQAQHFSETCRHSSMGCERTRVQSKTVSLSLICLMYGPAIVSDLNFKCLKMYQAVAATQYSPKRGRAVWLSTTSCISEPLCFNFVHFDLQFHHLETSLKQKARLHFFWVQAIIDYTFHSKNILHCDEPWYLVSPITGEDRQ